MKTLYNMIIFGIALVVVGACGGPSPTPTSPDELKAQQLTFNGEPTATAASNDPSATGKVANDYQADDDAAYDDVEEQEDDDVYGGQYGKSAEEEYANDDDSGDNDEEGGDDEGGKDEGNDDGDYDEDGAELFW